MSSIAIVDYGMGNVGSVRNALSLLGAKARVTMQSDDFEAASHIILPGVGAFADGMRELRERGLIDILNREVRDKNKPFLGICLGMELLGSDGVEGGTTQGLDYIRGSVRRFLIDEDAFRLPHIGWNNITTRNAATLFRGIGTHDFYFVHSYILTPEDERDVSATCDYGVVFAAAVERENVFGTQFHPEKSQKAGLAVLRNFLNYHAQ
ncbi:imidazole glycerol phosphate synthase subunit HisH [Candidatus Kaiserbacteria bacterium]|nr:imidazole glycerol phosphate synthase subunit HisH [Candidatus Kaiserbacteria bacterium]